jgi:3-deoxy-D-manno-octulosonic acid kinase
VIARLAAPFPPLGYRRWRQGRHDVIAWETVVDPVREALESAGDLTAWAAPRAERTVETGRGTVYAVRLGPILAAVRHFHRGGWMAPLLGDRYSDSPPRPFAELAVSERIRAAGVMTPRILAAIVTPIRFGYQADLATVWLEPGHDLEALLTPNRYPPSHRAAALEAAGATIGRAHRAGLDHADLNLANVFVQPREAGRWTAALLDLDRARLVDPAPAAFKKKTSTASTGRSRRLSARVA